MNPISRLLERRHRTADYQAAVMLPVSLKDWNLQVLAAGMSPTHHGIRIVLKRLPETPSESPFVGDHLQLLVSQGHYYLGGSDSLEFWCLGSSADSPDVIAHLAWMFARGHCTNNGPVTLPMRDRK